MRRAADTTFLRNFIFGAEDSLVSTVGLLSGVAIAGVAPSQIVLTGIVLIFVEAFSMGIGSMVSEHTADEARRGKATALHRSLLPGVTMFVSYFFWGLIPLAPYIISPANLALVLSVIASLAALFGLGLWSGRAIGIRPASHGLQMLMLGGLAIVIGMAVGAVVQ